MPLVDLALAEPEFVWNASDVVSGPVRILFEFVLKNLQLLLVFPLTAFDITISYIAVLGLLQQCGNAIIQVVVLKLVLGDVEEGGEDLVVLGSAPEDIWILSHDIIFFGVGLLRLLLSSFILLYDHRLITEVRGHCSTWGIRTHALLLGGAIVSAILDLVALANREWFSIWWRWKSVLLVLIISHCWDGVLLMYLLFVLIEAHLKFSLCWDHLCGWHGLERQVRSPLWVSAIARIGWEKTDIVQASCGGKGLLVQDRETFLLFN